MRSLPVFLSVRDRPVILIGEGEAAEAKRRLLIRAGARIVDEQETAVLAIVAIGEEAEASAAVGRLRARGVLINAVDRPHLCDFTLPAIVDRDPVLIAIGTGGASAGLAKALRQRIETLLPASLGALAEALHAARPALRRRFPDPAGRRRAIDSALDREGPLDPLVDHGPNAVTSWLEEASAPDADHPARIRLRSSDPDDLTLREARLLARADAIFYPADIPPAILARARADACRSSTPPPEHSTGRVVILEWAAD